MNQLVVEIVLSFTVVISQSHHSNSHWSRFFQHHW